MKLRQILRAGFPPVRLCTRIPFGCSLVLIAALAGLVAPGRAAADAHSGAGSGLGPGIELSTSYLAVPEAGFSTFSVVLTSPPAANVRLVLTRRDGGDPDLWADTGVLIFTPATWSDPQPVVVTAGEDANSGSGGAVFEVTARSDDAGYDGLDVPLLVAVEEDSSARAGVNVSTRLLSMGEDGTAVYTIALNSRPRGDVRITVDRKSGDGAVIAGFGTRGLSSVTFTREDWNAPRQVVVRRAEDSDAAAGEVVFTHLLSSDDDRYDSESVGGFSDVTVRAPDAVFSAPGVSLSRVQAEGGTTGWTVVLDSSPSAPVRIAVEKVSGAAPASAVPALLTFSRDTWDLPQAVTVQGAGGMSHPGTGSTWGHWVSSADPAYDGLVLYTDPALSTDALTDTDESGSSLGNPGVGVGAGAMLAGAALAAVALGGEGSTDTDTNAPRGPPTGPFWSARFKVGNASPNLGYCPGTCPVGQPFGTQIPVDSFTNPGTGETVTVTAVVWNRNNLGLRLFLDPLPGTSGALSAAAVRPAVFEAWTLTVAGVSVALSDNDRVGMRPGDTATSIQFDNFFSSEATRPGADADVDVSLSFGDDAGEQPPEDTTAPTVTSIARVDGSGTALGELTNADTVRLLVTFSETVANVDAADFGASGTTATATGVTGSGAGYTVTLGGGNLADLDGTVGLTFASAQNIADEAGNALVTTTPTGADETYTVDNTGPTVALARADGLNTTLTGAFNVTVTFTEANGLQPGGPGAFAAGDLSVTNGTVTTLTPPNDDSLVWTAEVTPTANFMGDVLVDLPADGVEDVAGNGNSAATQLSVPVDTRLPPELPWSATLTVARGTVSEVGYCPSPCPAVSSTFNQQRFTNDSFTVPGTSDTVTVNGIVWSEASGNLDLRLFLDPVPVQSVYEAWTLTVHNTTVALSDNDGVSTLTDHDAISIQFDDFFDNAAARPGNGASITLSLAVGGGEPPDDTTAPTVTSIARVDGSGDALEELTNADTVRFLVTFSETVANVDSGDFGASGTTATATGVTGSDATYTVTLGGGDLATVDGTVGLTFASAQDIADAAGNALDATLPAGANNETYTLDNTAPTVVSIERDDGNNNGTDPGALTNADSLTFLVTFSEAAANVSVGDFELNGAGLDSASASVAGTDASRTSYLMFLFGSNLAAFDGEVGLTLASGQDIADGVGNALVVTTPTGATETYTLDNTGPTVALTRTDGLNTTVTGAFDVTVTFTEANGLQTTGDGAFTAGDLSVPRGTATVEATDDPLVWTAEVTPDEDVTGDVLVDLPAGGVLDMAGNGNSAATQLSVPADTGAVPTVVSIERDSGNGTDPGAVTNGNTLTFGVTFSEAVTNVNAADFEVSGTTASVTNVSGEAAGYMVTLFGGDLQNLDGTVGLTFASAQNIADAAGNALDATLPVGTNYETYTVDNTAPTVVLALADGQTEPLTGAFDVTVTFTETNGLQTASADAGAFTVADLSVMNGTATSVTVTADPLVWTAVVTPTAGHTGDVLVDLPADGVEDVAGNGNSAASQLSVRVEVAADTTAPTVTSIVRVDGSGAALGALTNADTVRFLVTFSETVANVDSGDFEASGDSTATATNVTGSAATRTVTLSGGDLATFDGEVGLTFASAQNIADAAGNALVTTTPTGDDETYTVDNTGPTVVLALADGQTEPLTGAFDVTVTFTEANGLQTTGAGAFAVADLSVTDGTATSVTVTAADPLVWTAVVTPTAGHTGNVLVDLAADGVEDVAGNGNSAATQLSVQVGTTAPPELPWSATLNVRAATSLAPFAAGYCPAGSCPIDGHSLGTKIEGDSFTVPGTGDTVTVTAVVWGVSTDLSLRLFLDPLPEASVYEAWTLTIDHTTDTTVALADNDRVGMRSGDTATSIQFDDFFASTGERPASSDSITVSLAVGGVEPPDDTTAPTVTSIARVDGSGTALGAVTNADTVLFLVTFSETVANVDSTDFEASGDSTATATNVTGSADSYTVTLSGGDLATFDGEVGLTFASAQNIADAAGNALVTTTPTGDDETYTVDNTGPTVVLALADGQTEPLTGAFDVTVTFTEANGLQTASGDAGAFTTDDLSVMDGTATSVTVTSDPLVWTAVVTPTAGHTGNVLVDLAADGVEDVAGNGNSAATQLSVQVDNTAPTVTSIARVDSSGTALGAVTNADTVRFLVTFSETVANVDSGDFEASGDSTATATNVTGSAATRTVTLSGGDLATFDGEVGLTFASGQNIADAAGNALVTTTPTGDDETYTVDNTGPTVVLALADGQTEPLTGAFNVTVTFTEANGLQTASADAGAFTTDDLSVMDGTATSVTVTSDPLVWTAVVTPTAGHTGNVLVDLAADGVEDVAGNGNSAATQLSVQVDNTAPTVTSIARVDSSGTALGAVTNADTVLFLVTFSETVANVDSGDFEASGDSTATATNVTGSADSYTVTLSGGDLATFDGEVGLTFASAQNIADEAANALVTTTPTGDDETYTVDNTGPTVVLARADGLNTTLTGVFNVTVTFTEANGLQTTGPGAFATEDLNVTDGTATSVTVTATDPLVWTAVVTPTANFMGNVLVDLDADGVEDVAGNGNRAATQLSVPVLPTDAAAPTVLSIERVDGDGADPGAVTRADSLMFLVTFSEAVDNVNDADFEASGVTTASVTAVTGSADSYTVTLGMGDLAAFDGTVGLTFASAHKIVDEAGNGLVTTTPSGADETYTVDNTGPTVVLALADGQTEPLTGAFNVTVTFTEANGLQTTGGGAFAVGDLSVTDGTATSVTVTTADPLVWTAVVTPTAGHTGNVLVDLAADGVEDAAGNGNSAATQLSVRVDNTAPSGPLWSATLTVSSGTVGEVGYCPSPCPAFSSTFGHLRFTNDSFTVPGTSDTVTVTGIVWSEDSGNLDLRLFLDPVPAQSVYEAWTLTVHNTTVALSDNDGVSTLTDHDAISIQFDDFFDNAAARPADESSIMVSISVDEPPDTTLSALSLAEADSTAVTLSPTFASGTTSYTASVASDVSSLTVVATAAGAPTATVAISPADSDTSTNGHQVALSTGDTVVTATVSNGSATQDYTIRITRPPVLESLWSATLTVGEGSSIFGYCASTCTVVDGNVFGTLGESDSNQFMVPGTSDTVTVRAIVWNSGTFLHDLRLILDPLPAKSVYEQWVLTVDGITFNLSDNDRVGTHTDDQAGTTSIQFDNFFSSGVKPSGTITVSLAVGEYVRNDTTLNALSLSNPDGTDIALSPGFSSGTTGYKAFDPGIVSPLTVVATATDANASVVIDPADSDQATAGHQVAVTRDTFITATVTNGRDIQTYVIQAAPADPEPEPLWSATLTVAEVTALINSYGYCPSGSCPITASTQTLGTKIEDDSFTVPGTSDTVTVTAVIWERSNDRSLRLHLTPLPESSVYEQWTLTVDNTAVALSDNDRVGRHVHDGAEAMSIQFDDFFGSDAARPGNGDSITVSISVGGDDGGGGDPDTTLSALTLADPDDSPVTLTPAFASATTEYAASVTSDVAFVTVAATAAGAPTATVAITPEDSDDTTDGHQVPLDFGETEVTATVSNGSAEEDYTITVTRADGPLWSATLTVASVSHGSIVGRGYCPSGSCPVTGLTLGTKIEDDSFTVPGTSDTVTVTAIVWGPDAFDRELRLFLDPLPAQSVYEAWTLTVHETAVALSANNGVSTLSGDTATSIQFERFFGDRRGHAPGENSVINVSLSGVAEESSGTGGSAIGTSAPAGFSVSDAEAHEDAGAQLAFNVSLDQRLEGEARVAVSTRDGSARAGQDYEAVSDTLIFAPGETEKTVLVPVLDDAHDEGREEMTLVLSEPVGAAIADGEGAGVIVNSDAIPKAWIARFGRTVTSQVLDAVEARLSASRQTGWRATLAGQAMPSWNGEPGANLSPEESPSGWRDWLARLEAEREGAGLNRRRARGLTEQDLMTGTAFELTAEADPADPGAHYSVWGGASVAGFDGREDGLNLDGRVMTGLVGADWTTDGWMAGLAVGHSMGTGGYRRGGCTSGRGCGGSIEADLTGLYPYAGLDLSERITAWAAAGYGTGELTVTPDGAEAITTDLTMSMGAVGLRGEVLAPESAGGLSLAVTTEARATRTESEAARGPGGNLAEATADVWTGRLGLEGARRFRFGNEADGASLTPSFEMGLRLDGGDAERGLGADIGGGLALADPETGLSLDLKGRGLLIHEEAGFREWGASAALSWDPQPTTERGLSLSLDQSWGASPSDRVDALLRPDTFSGFATGAGGRGRFEASGRLRGEVGYGVPIFGDDFTGTFNAGFGLSPNDRRDYRFGWRLSRERPRQPDVELRFDANRREAANDDPEHGVAIRGTIRLRW